MVLPLLPLLLAAAFRRRLRSSLTGSMTGRRAVGCVVSQVMGGRYAEAGVTGCAPSPAGPVSSGARQM